MKRSALFTIALFFSFLLFASTADAQTKGNGNGSGSGQKINWVDSNGDGICDNFGTSLQGSNSGKGYGKKDGTGTGIRPQDGTGYGKKGGNGTGTGVCDGTGPKGSASRKGGK
ncbi:MAG: hypothetical protein C4539_03055 [Ignavibacteriales bacterium]|nr:MAG: hypothetical protein C4539_03055 [Ignavibacteriales bacterium]